VITPAPRVVALPAGDYSCSTSHYSSSWRLRLLCESLLFKLEITPALRVVLSQLETSSWRLLLLYAL